MQSCTAKFIAAEASSARAVKSQVYLILGDYSTSPLSTVASSGDYSTDYPAAGAINGDRTELNIGPAASAENGVGKAMWRSPGVPGAGDYVFWAVDFGTPRIINRLKIYQLIGHGINYKVEYFSGGNWILIGAVGGGGFGDNPFGDYPYGDPAGMVWGSVTTDFPDITTTSIRITVTGTTVPLDYANIVEVEAYRLVDISSRVLSWELGRDRDFKLRSDMASSVSLVCNNTDKYFTPNYVPTAAEVTAGFVNSELRSQLGLYIKAGFEWSGSQVELLPQFTGAIDQIKAHSKSRIANIEARDGMKKLFSPITTALLKPAIALHLAIQYVLNLRNISTWDMALDDSKLTIPYFFVASGNDAKKIVDDLVVASGDGQFYFDESGVATYRQYATTVPNNYVYYQKVSTQPSQPGWSDYDSIQNISLDRQADKVTIKWPNVDGWANGDFTSNPAWTRLDDGTALQISGGKLTDVNARVARFLYLAFPFTTGTIEYYSEATASASWDESTHFYFHVAVPTYAAGVQPWYNYAAGQGYHLSINYSVSSGGRTSLIFYRDLVSIASYSYVADINPAWVTITRAAGGVWKIYYRGVLLITVTDNTYTSFAYLTCGGFKGDDTTWALSSIYYTEETTDVSSNPNHETSTPTWISEALDLNSDVVSLGTLEATIVSQAGCTPTMYTRTSADAISWDAWVQVNPNATMGSVARRWLRVKMEYSSMDYNFGSLPTPSLNDLTINWIRSGSVTKYPAVSTRAIAYNGNLLDVTDTASDTLGGDNSILNDILIVGQPYNLTGADADIVWEYLTGTPANVVSATNPLFVNVGTVTFTANIPGGMDTSLMTGAALNVVYGTAVGTASISIKSPTAPVITLTISSAGTITALQLLGKAFSTSVRNFTAESKDNASILQNDLKPETLNSPWILNSGVAKNIADSRLANYKNETRLLDNVNTTLQPSSQMGDRVTVTDLNTAISADYWVVGIREYYSSSQIYTIYKLWRIP